MKKLLYFLFILFFAVLYTGCSSDKDDDDDDDNPPSTSGTISGVISLPPGAAGDINNTRVAIYQSFDDWNNDRVLKFTRTNPSGAYTMTNVAPGTYYMDAWKDNDNNTFWSRGDFIGVYGSGSYPNYQLSPFQVVAGQNTNITFEIIVVPN